MRPLVIPPGGRCTTVTALVMGHDAASSVRIDLFLDARYIQEYAGRREVRAAADSTRPLYSAGLLGGPTFTLKTIIYAPRT